MNRKPLFRRRRPAARPLKPLPRASPQAEALEPRTLLAFGSLGPEFRVNTTTAGDQVGAAIAADALGNFVVAWSGPGADPASNDVYARRYSATGDPLGDEFLVNTTTAGNQFSPAVAVDNAGDFVVAWTSYDADGSEVYARRYGADGRPQGGEFRVDTGSSGAYGRSAVAMDADGDFAVAWTGSDVLARRFDAAGQPLGDAFAVSEPSSDAKFGPSVAMDADGDLTVAWTDGYSTGYYGSYYYPLTNHYVVRMRRYDSAGQPTGGEAQLPYDGLNPSVAMDDNGDFVVAWNTYSYGQYIVAQRFDSTGQSVGETFAGSYAGDSPSAALAADGTLFVAWNQLDWPSSWNVYGQRFDAANQPLGPEFRVNTFVSGNQFSAAVAAGAGGGFVVAWNSFGQDGSGYGVYGQRFGEGGAPPPPPPPSISAGDVSVTEGNTGTTSAVFTVSLSSASDQTVAVDYSTADAGALAGSDYVAASGTLTFAPGETSKTVPVAVRGDVVDEFDQGFVLNLSNATNGIIADSQGLATILDDDAPPTISINDVSLAEGHKGRTAFTFTVSLSAVSEKTVQASFSTANGTATLANADYTAASGTLVFSPGQTSKTIVVQVIGDRRKEANEYFLVNLLGVSNALVGDAQGRGNILNDDGPA